MLNTPGDVTNSLIANKNKIKILDIYNFVETLSWVRVIGLFFTASLDYRIKYIKISEDSVCFPDLQGSLSQWPATHPLT